MGLNMDRKVLEDCSKNVNVAAVLVRGRPVALNSSGEVVMPDATNPLVQGLSSGDKNSFRDDTYGEYAAFGSGKMGISKAGIAKVSPSVFDTATGTSTLHVYDPGRTYLVGQKLYAELRANLAQGLITNDAAARNVDSDSEPTNFLGRVLTVPNSALEMEIDLQTL